MGGGRGTQLPVVAVGAGAGVLLEVAYLMQAFIYGVLQYPSYAFVVFDLVTALTRREARKHVSTWLGS